MGLDTIRSYGGANFMSQSMIESCLLICQVFGNPFPSSPGSFLFLSILIPHSSKGSCQSRIAPKDTPSRTHHNSLSCPQTTSPRYTSNLTPKCMSHGTHVPNHADNLVTSPVGSQERFQLLAPLAPPTMYSLIETLYLKTTRGLLGQFHNPCLTTRKGQRSNPQFNTSNVHLCHTIPPTTNPVGKYRCVCSLEIPPD